jgi:hypothetical protein
MTPPRRLFAYLLCATLIHTAAAAPKKDQRFKKEQTLTLSSIPKKQRIPGGSSIGTAVSISGDWLAVQQASFLSPPVVHLFQRQPKLAWTGKPWKWRAAISCGNGDIHLNNGELICKSPDQPTLQVHALADGEWSKVQEIPLAGYWGLKFVGSGGKLAFWDSFPGTSSRTIQALDRDPQSGTWSIQEVVSAQDSIHLWSVSDRQGDKIIASCHSSGSAATIFQKVEDIWSPITTLPQPAGAINDSPLFVPPSYAAVFAGEGRIAALVKYVDFLGNPTDRDLLQYEENGEGAWKLSGELEVEGELALITMVGDLVTLHGGLMDFFGNPLMDKMVIFDGNYQGVTAPEGKVNSLSWSGDRMVTSDGAIDSLGNPIGGGAIVYRMVPPKGQH